MDNKKTEDKFYNFLQKNINTIFGILIFLAFASPLLLTREGFIDFTNTGQIGDTIGGLTAPFLNLLGAILIYLTFKEQINANNETKKELANRQIKEDDRLQKIKNLIIWDLENRILKNSSNIIEEIDSFLPLFKKGNPIKTIDHVDFNRDIFFANNLTDYYNIFNKDTQDLATLLNIYNRINFIYNNTPINVYKKFKEDNLTTTNLIFKDQTEKIKYLDGIKLKYIKNLEALTRNLKSLELEITEFISKYK